MPILRAERSAVRTSLSSQRVHAAQDWSNRTLHQREYDRGKISALIAAGEVFGSVCRNRAPSPPQRLITSHMLQILQTTGSACDAHCSPHVAPPSREPPSPCEKNA